MERVLSLVRKSVSVSSILDQGTSSINSSLAVLRYVVFLFSLMVDFLFLIIFSFYITSMVESGPAIGIHGVDVSVAF